MKKNYTAKNENLQATLVIASVFIITAVITILSIYFG